MSNLRGRVDKLEAAIGEAGPRCASGGTSVVVNWGEPTAEDAPPETCEVCGKPLNVVIVRWPDDTERNQEHA